MKLTNRLMMVSSLIIGLGGIATATNANTLSKDASTWSERSTKPTMDQVREAQMALNRETSAGLSEDGIVGPQTEAAVRLFQTEKGLSASGELDVATFRALNVEINPEVDRTPASLPYDPSADEVTPK